MRIACWRDSKKEMTPWRSFEISRRFAAHHTESLAANRWSLRHSDHEEVASTNHSAHWAPLIRIHTYNGIANFSLESQNFWNGYNSRKRRHSDSLDTLLYVRFAIQNLEFYEWKLGDHGWALSWHRTHTLFALWPDVTSCFTYKKTESEEVFSIVSYIRFKNLQFHWRIYNSIGVCILMRGVQWALWLSPLRDRSAWAISGLQPSSVRGERRSVG